MFLFASVLGIVFLTCFFSAFIIFLYGPIKDDESR